jgi:hypothetical protein
LLEIYCDNFDTSQAIQADPGLGSFQGQIPMNCGRNPDHEFAAKASGGNGFRRFFTLFTHILYNLRYHLPDAFQGGFGAPGQPA